MKIKFLARGTDSREAEILCNGSETVIRSGNPVLEERLLGICSKPVRQGRSVLLDDGYIGYESIDLFPGGEEFFREAAYLFRSMDYEIQIEEERINSILALDFDGTLWDSVDECYLASIKAFQSLGRPLPEAADLENRFRRGRFFAATGKDFYRIIEWIGLHPDRDPLSMTADEEAGLRGETDPKADRFEKTFYQIRDSWMKNDFAGWAGVQGPYPGVIDQVRRLEKRFSKIVIATTKDVASAKALLATQGLTFDIIGKEYTTDKMKQMIYLSKNYKKSFDEIIFVDDLPLQVKAVKSLGAKVALAGWGYNSDRQKEEARKLGIPVLELENFADSLINMNEL